MPRRLSKRAWYTRNLLFFLCMSLTWTMSQFFRTPRSGLPQFCQATDSFPTRRTQLLLHQSQVSASSRSNQISLISTSAAGLFTPAEYVSRQRQVQEQAESAAAAAEKLKEATNRALSLELQVGGSSSIQVHSHFSFLNAAKESAARGFTQENVI
jgi:hypothetical protein